VSVHEMPSLLAPHLRPGRFGAPGASPLTISERRVAVVQIMARDGQSAAVGAAVERTAGVKLPAPGESAMNGDTTALWIAPDTWLLLRELPAGEKLVDDLTAACGRSASIVDQTCGKTAIRLSGAHARDVLAKGCRLDLHPRAFGPGRSAVTPIAHIQTVIVQVDATPAFELLVPSTLAQDFAAWLCVSAAQFGYEIK